MRTAIIPQPVLSVLSRCTTADSKLFLPPGQLDRKMYVDVNKVLEAAGGKWTRGAKAHVFAEPAAEILDNLILTGAYEKSARDAFDYFPTPTAIVEILLRKADLTAGMRVLEPSAGRGAIARPCRALGCLVECCEIAGENARALTDEGFAVVAKDFIEFEPSPGALYDRVLMNPPFSRRRDVKHVTQALRFLKPGGRLVAIMSAGVTFREDRLGVEFRSLLEERRGTLDRLPEGSFKESGTMVNACIVTMEG